MMLAAAVFLLCGACHVAAGPAWVYGLGMPAGITLSFVGIGLGMSDYTHDTMLWICVGTPALWGFMYLIGELDYASATGWSWGIGLVGLVALVKAIKGANADAS